MSWVEGFLKAIRELQARYFFAVAFVAAGVVVLFNGPLAEWLGLPNGPKWLKASLSITALVCTALGGIKAYSGWSEARVARLKARESQASFERRLRDLTPDEFSVMGRFLDKNSKTALFLDDNLGRTALSLAASGFLYPLSREQTQWATLTTYRVDDSVFSFLRENLEMVRLGRGDQGETAGSQPTRHRETTMLAGRSRAHWVRGGPPFDVLHCPAGNSPSP